MVTPLQATLMRAFRLTTVIEESDEKTRVESAFTLPERIRARKEETSRQRSILAEHRGRVQTLVTQINEVHCNLSPAFVLPTTHPGT